MKFNFKEDSIKVHINVDKNSTNEDIKEVAKVAGNLAETLSDYYYQKWRKRFTDSDIDEIRETTLRQIFDAIDDEDKYI